MNPHLCNICERFAEANPGGTEMEVALLFADIRGFLLRRGRDLRIPRQRDGEEREFGEIGEIASSSPRQWKAAPQLKAN